MKTAVGLVGLPNAGKSTLFKLLTGQEVNIAKYPFCTINPNVGVSLVPDERLDKLQELEKKENKINAVIEFIDIAGLVKNAHKGEGLGNQFLGHIREVDVIIIVLRNFWDESVSHLEGEIDPERDLKIILEELRKKDEESKEKVNLLSTKPKIYLINGHYHKIDPTNTVFSDNVIKFDILSEDDENKLQKVHQIIKLAYQALNLITFFTIGKNEVRAWAVKRGCTAPEAGKLIHSDFQEHFIKVEVINWEQLIAAGNWHQAKRKGWVRLEGKEYQIQDGDVVLYKI